jgi:hypothetical protein
MGNITVTKAGALSMKVRAAYHEAGHAVTAFCFGFVIKEVIIHYPAVDGRHGCCELGTGELTKAKDVSAALAFTMEGDVAEEQWSAKRLSFFKRSYSDYLNFERLFLIYRNDETVDDIFAAVERVREAVRVDYIDPNWPMVARVANALAERGRLSGDEVRDLCAGRGLVEEMNSL